MTFKDRLKSLGFSSYNDYLHSPHWFEFRQTYRNSGRQMACAVCGNKKKLNLHHHTYDRLGDELLDDIVPLCRQHHIDVHDWLNTHNLFVGSTSQAISALRGEAIVLPRGPEPRLGKKYRGRDKYIGRADVSMGVKKNKPRKAGPSKKKAKPPIKPLSKEQIISGLVDVTQWMSERLKAKVEYAKAKEDYHYLEAVYLSLRNMASPRTPRKAKFRGEKRKRGKPAKSQRKDDCKVADHNGSTDKDWRDPIIAMRMIAAGLKIPR